MRQLILGTGLGYEKEIPIAEQIVRIKNAGWDGIFTEWDEHRGIKEYARIAKENDLVYGSVHAPFDKVDQLWEKDGAGDAETERLARCIRETAEIGVGIVVMHAIIGFDKYRPTNIGVSRFYKLVQTAEEYGVKIAFENTEGSVYLDTLLEAFSDYESVGFCIDTGHEMCYNYGHDLIGKYCNQLIATHLNDNMKVTGRTITWLDDAHMLPFDGRANWHDIAARLKLVGYEGPFTFEVTSKSKPHRATHDRYSTLNFDEFVSLALRKAKKFASMMDD
ncbi:MAG: sugar phosphate isomerase/epimerase [Clostridia bacterium]|nr:sugar phosphate isomerase/epimerase [Clostridia bacterium]